MNNNHLTNQINNNNSSVFCFNHITSNNKIFMIDSKKLSDEISEDLIKCSQAYGWFDIEQGDVDCKIYEYLYELKKELYKQITKNLEKNNKIVEELIA